MYKVFLFPIIVFLMFGRERVKPLTYLNPQKVIVTGEMKSDTLLSQVVRVHSCDILCSENNWGLPGCAAGLLATVDTLTRQFRLEFELSYPQDLVLQYGETSFLLYLAPSDSLHIVIRNKEVFRDENAVVFTGDHAEMNKNMLVWQRLKQDNYSSPDCAGKSVKQYLDVLAGKIEKEQVALNQFAKKYSADSTFIKWAKTDILYNNANYLISYKAYCSMNGLPQSDSIMDVKMFPVDNVECLQSSMFGYHVYHNAMDKYITHDDSVNYYFKSNAPYRRFKRVIHQIWENEPEGLLRDYMIERVLNEVYNSEYSVFKKLWQEDSSLIHNLMIRRKIDQAFQMKEKQMGQSILEQLDFTPGEQQLMGNIVNRLMELSVGRVVYLDIWSTGCGYCLREMVPFKELHELYKDNANLVFVDWCIGDTRERWKELTKDMPGEHFYVDQDQGLLLRNKLQFIGFPTYMILRDGKLVHPNTFRPSFMDKVREVLDKELILL